MNNINVLRNTILLVEDNPVDVDLTLRAFKFNKLTNPIEVARDGHEVMSWIKNYKKGEPLPVVILLDLKLPKYSGLEVLKAIKSNTILKSIPVVVLTTSSEDDDIGEAYQLGVNSYIVKPVDFLKFIEVVRQIELYWSVLNKTSIH
ncbi:response regulator [Plebeiibacterium sediminum]|uniref:Response regulator n=1 Tax=Plebeiibacterium sediminum TaxID=2992112 RepID=A0AAE3M5V9_9BACT|nr:response regulator [Plebeiobacterium sediminum]MCW3787482.1 response regulator [Plebeiobacterium sediminum]